MNRIDEMGRVLLPKKTRGLLDWEKGDKIELSPNVNEKSLSVKLASDNSENQYEIDDLSRIKIPSTILEMLGWGYANALEHTVIESDSSISMMKVA